MQQQKTIFSFFNRSARSENPKSGQPASLLYTGKPPASGRDAVFPPNHQLENRSSGGSSYTEILNRSGKSHSQSGLVAEGFKLAAIAVIETPPEKTESRAAARCDLDDIRKFDINNVSEDAVAESLPNGQPVSYHQLSGTKMEKNMDSFEQPSSNLRNAAAIRFCGNNGSILSHVETQPNIFGPERPVVRPFVPRLNWFQDECKPEDMLSFHPPASRKRQKPLEDLSSRKKGRKKKGEILVLSMNDLTFLP